MGRLTSAEFPIIPKFELFRTINSVQNINDILGDALLVEILQRLPCVYVCRAKSICKRWQAVIEENHFIPAYIRYHDQLRLTENQLSLSVTLVYQFIFWHRVLNEEPGSKIHTVSDSDSEIHLGFLPCFRPWAPRPIWVAASTKDLLVCCDAKISLKSTYYICNPLTKQWVVVPSVAGHHKVADTAMGLVVSKKDIFRLVRVPELESNPSNNRFEAEVFISETGKWTKVLVPCPSIFKRSWHFKPNAIVINNKLHWLVNSEIVVMFDPFETNKTSCEVINLPSELNSQMSICLGSSQDRLKVCQLIGGYPNGQLVIYKHEDNGPQKWDLECKISLKDMVFNDINQYFNDYGSTIVEVLGLHPNDQGILYLRIRNQIVVSNLRRMALEVVRECLGDSTFSVGTCGVFLLTHPFWPSSIPSVS